MATEPADDDIVFPVMPDMSWVHWHAACVFCMAGVEDETVGKILPWSEEQWENANDFYGNIHIRAKHPTALPFSDEQQEWQRQFLINLLAREAGFDIAPFDPQPFIAMAKDPSRNFDFGNIVNLVRDAIHADSYVGPFRDVPWKARQIGKSVSDFAPWLFHDDRTIYLYGEPLKGKDGKPLDDIDPMAFRMVGRFFAADDRQGYAFVQHKQFPYIQHVVPLPGVDPQGFAALNHAYAADGSAVYHRNGKRLTKDVNGFEILPDPAGDFARSEKAQDGRQTYAGDKVLEGRTWSPPEGTAPCPVRTIVIDDHIVLPPAYRLFAAIERDADGRPPRGTDVLVQVLREQFGAMFRVGRVMVGSGKFPRVKLTPAHWEKLETAIPETQPHDGFRAEFYDRLDHHGLAAETPSACLDGGYHAISLDIAFPPEIDWRHVDATLWPHIEAFPVLYAVQGYGMATEMRAWADRDAALRALAVRKQCACGLGLRGDDMARFCERPENGLPATSLSPDYRPIPDLGFKTLIGAQVLENGLAKRLRTIAAARVSTASNGATLVQLGDRPIWGVEGDDAALIAAYRKARSVLSRHGLTEDLLVGGVYGDWAGELAGGYLKDWR